MNTLTFNTESWWSKLPKLLTWVDPERDKKPPVPGDTVTYRRYKRSWSQDWLQHYSTIDAVLSSRGKNRYGIFEYQIITTEGDTIQVGRYWGHDEGRLFWKRPVWVGLNWDGGYFDDK